MSTALESRIESAVEVLESFLSKADLKVDSKSWLKHILLNMGIDDSEIGLQTLDAETTTFDDFKQNIEEDIPFPRLKLAWSLLKKQEKIKNELAHSDVSSLVQTLRPIGQWSDLEVLEKYSKDCPQEIEEELKRRSKGRNCIIFFEDRTVDVENSLYMIRKARYQDTPSTFLINEQIKQLYKVGEFPLDALFECPIHSNILLIDGYCEECGAVWNTQNTEHLTFLRLIKENTSTDPILYRNMNFAELTKQFPKINIIYQQLKDEDKLPSLKRRISKSNSSDPFRVSTHRQF